MAGMVERGRRSADMTEPQPDSSTFRRSAPLREGPITSNRTLGAILAQYRNESTGDKVGSMKTIIRDEIGRGYGPGLRNEVRALGEGEETNTLFLAALDIFWKENGRHASEAGKMAEDLLGKVPESVIGRKLTHTKPAKVLMDSIPEKREGAARLLGRMCRRIAEDAEALSDQIGANIQSLAFDDKAFRAAADEFRRYSSDVVEVAA